MSAFPTCCKQRFKETHSHLRDRLLAASPAHRSLPESLNAEDLSVSISQLISPSRSPLPLQPIHPAAPPLPARAIPPRIRGDSRSCVCVSGAAAAVSRRKSSQTQRPNPRLSSASLGFPSVGLLLTVSRSNLHRLLNESGNHVETVQHTSG